MRTSDAVIGTSTQNRTVWQKIKPNIGAYALFLPVFIYVLIFHYGPMYGITLAFRNYLAGDSLFPFAEDVKWIGFDNFVKFFTSLNAVRIFRNTLLINLYSLLWGFWVPIAFSLLLNEIKHIGYKKTMQTFSYLPYFISTAIIGGLTVSFLNLNDGFINDIIELFGGARQQWLSLPEAFKTIYITINIWKGFGWGSILYIAALAGVDQSLYESARIDGANRLQQAWHISLPGMSQTIFILLIFNISGMLGGEIEVLRLINNPLNAESSATIALHVYNEGITRARYGYATAAGFFTSVISFILLAVTNKISKETTEYSLW